MVARYPLISPTKLSRGLSKAPAHAGAFFVFSSSISRSSKPGLCRPAPDPSEGSVAAFPHLIRSIVGMISRRHSRSGSCPFRVERAPGVFRPKMLGRRPWPIKDRTALIAAPRNVASANPRDQQAICDQFCTDFLGRGAILIGAGRPPCPL
jgi:hypothetical protein